jgi:flagellar biogenesis protein FliO
MHARLAILAVGFLLAVGASAAEPVHLVTTPTTAPTAAVIEDASRNLPLPARSSVPTTQSATAGRAASAGSDPLDVKRMAVALAIVLGAMYVTHLVWKRLGMPGSANRNAGALQVISRLNLSPKQQVVLLRVGRRVVLIGNSGGQMNSLCEIGDAEEVAGLLGQAATERTDSISAESFNSVLGTEEKRFEDEQNADVPAHGGDAGAEEHQALSNTRDELSDMMDKVRNLSRQFRPNPKGE